ncbi:hypothetical protein AB0323_11405 [Arthrobacter sp. NPDC080031]|uniref:hypothetical protein n=1 Tax=Arthrobacter sp. NPDC080031 TaxID=3155918 RepID=UPI00344BCDB5
MSTQSTRIILDTNLWSTLDDGSLPRLETLLEELDLQVQVLPSTLLEIVGIGREDVRKRLVAGLARGPRRTRVRTEADLFAEEVVELIRRTHPEWLRRIPDRAEAERLRTFWLKKIWRQALEDSTALHEHHGAQAPVRDHIVAGQKQNSKEMREEKFKPGDLTELHGKDDPESDSPPLLGELPGWNGSPRALWRLRLAHLTWHQLGVVGPRARITGEDRTMTDWIEPWVDLGKLRSSPESFVHMWLDEANVVDVPRNWLNWAVDFVQLTAKPGSGNPGDAQQASYLVGCDLFLTSDRRFVRVLERVREDAPFSFAETVLVDGNRRTDTPTAERIEQVLSHMAQARERH